MNAAARVQGALLPSRPDAAGEDADDVLAVHRSKGGYEIIAGSGQPEVISQEDIAVWSARYDSFQVERCGCEANFVAPATRFAGGIL